MGRDKEQTEVTLEEIKKRFNLTESDVTFLQSVNLNLKKSINYGNRRIKKQNQN